MKKEREPKYIPSPLNNNMINYKEYYMSMNEKIGYSLLIFIIGGLVGLVFYGGLFKSDGESGRTAKYPSKRTRRKGLNREIIPDMKH